MTILDQEKFSVAKELAEISANLSNAHVEFNKLKETTEEYMVGREKEAEERVLKVLKESREALDEVSNNHNELTGFNGELKAYADILKTIANEIIALFQDFNERMKIAENTMETRREEVSEATKLLKVERIQVQEDRKLLAIEQKNIYDGFRLLKDRRETLERAWKEFDLKNKK